MTDAEILKLLSTLGIDDLSYKCLPLLPLISVAWADGEVQQGERKVIMKAANDTFQVGPEGSRMLRNWLTYPPSEAYQERARHALTALCMRDGVSGVDLDAAMLSEAQRLSKRVAQAAGGLFGIRSISSEESESLDEIAQMMNIAKDASWSKKAKASLDSQPQRTRVVMRFDTDTLDLGGAMSGLLIPPEHPDTQIPIDGAIRIGSDPTCHVVASGASIAPVHATVRLEAGRHYIRDDSEPHQGVWVDGERIVERRLLGGERLDFGGGALLDFKLLRRVPRQMLD